MTQMGRNSIDGREMMAYVERIEAKEKQRKALGDDVGAIKAEAKAKGFTPKGLAFVVKCRKQKPNQFRENEDVRDLYLHAAGLANEPPLFKFVGSMAREKLGRDELVERLKEIVPIGGSITINVGGGEPVRLTRDKDGTVTAEDVKPEPAPAAPGAVAAPPPREMPPEASVASEDGAEELGKQAAKADRPIIDNPYPFGDARRRRWDSGWRKETGTDGMGSDDD